MKVFAVAALLAVGSAVSAQVPFDTLPAEIATSPSQPQGVACDVVNLQGGLAAGFLSWVPGDAVLATLFDPTGSGAPGDPGCAADFGGGRTFRLDSVAITLADEAAFGTGTGVTDAEYIISIHALAVPGDPTAGPGAVIAAQAVTLAADGSGTYPEVVAFSDVLLNQPFFVAWSLVSASPETITPLWDSVARPVGRQFVDNGGGFQDFTNFFTGGDTGWVDVSISGAVVQPGPQFESVPSLDSRGIALLILVLLGTALATRGRWSA